MAPSAKNEHLAINKSDVIHSLTSSAISAKYGYSMFGGDGLAIGLASITELAVGR